MSYIQPKSQSSKFIILIVFTSLNFLALLAVFYFLFFVPSDSSLIRVQQLEIVDEFDSVRVLITTDSLGSCIAFLDSLGEQRIRLSNTGRMSSLEFIDDTTQILVSQQGTFSRIQLCDSLGTGRVGLKYDPFSGASVTLSRGLASGQTLDGVGMVSSAFQQGFFVNDAESSWRRVNLGWIGGDTYGFELFDDSFGRRMLASTSSIGTALTINDSADSNRIFLAQLDSGETTGTLLSIKSRNGRAGIEAGVGSTTGRDGTITNYSESSIRLFDANGYLTWAAPYSFGY